MERGLSVCSSSGSTYDCSDCSPVLRPLLSESEAPSSPSLKAKQSSCPAEEAAAGFRLGGAAQEGSSDKASSSCKGSLRPQASLGKKNGGGALEESLAKASFFSASGSGDSSSSTSRRIVSGESALAESCPPSAAAPVEEAFSSKPAARRSVPVLRAAAAKRPPIAPLAKSSCAEGEALLLRLGRTRSETVAASQLSAAANSQTAKGVQSLPPINSQARGAASSSSPSSTSVSGRVALERRASKRLAAAAEAAAAKAEELARKTKSSERVDPRQQRQKQLVGKASTTAAAALHRQQQPRPLQRGAGASSGPSATSSPSASSSRLLNLSAATAGGALGGASDRGGWRSLWKESLNPKYFPAPRHSSAPPAPSKGLSRPAAAGAAGGDTASSEFSRPLQRETKAAAAASASSSVCSAPRLWASGLFRVLSAGRKAVWGGTGDAGRDQQQTETRKEQQQTETATPTEASGDAAASSQQRTAGSCVEGSLSLKRRAASVLETSPVIGLYGPLLRRLCRSGAEAAVAPSSVVLVLVRHATRTPSGHQQQEAAGSEVSAAAGALSPSSTTGKAGFVCRKRGRLGEVERLLQLQQEWQRAETVSSWKKARSLWEPPRRPHRRRGVSEGETEGTNRDADAH